MPNALAGGSTLPAPSPMPTLSSPLLPAAAGVPDTIAAMAATSPIAPAYSDVTAATQFSTQEAPASMIDLTQSPVAAPVDPTTTAVPATS